MIVYNHTTGIMNLDKYHHRDNAIIYIRSCGKDDYGTLVVKLQWPRTLSEGVGRRRRRWSDDHQVLPN